MAAHSAALLLHRPLFAWWLGTAVLLGATLVELVLSPRHGLVMLAPLTATIGLVNIMGRAKGTDAWPTRADFDALRGNLPQPLLPREAGADTHET